MCSVLNKNTNWPPPTENEFLRFTMARRCPCPCPCLFLIVIELQTELRKGPGLKFNRKSFDCSRTRALLILGTEGLTRSGGRPRRLGSI